MPQQRKGPKGGQVETAFGLGFRVLSDAIKTQLRSGDRAEEGLIRVALLGTNGGHITLREGDDGYDVVREVVTRRLRLRPGR